MGGSKLSGAPLLTKANSRLQRFRQLQRICPRCPLESGKQLVFRVRDRSGPAHDRLLIGTVSWTNAKRVSDQYYPDRVTPCKLIRHADGTVDLGVSDRAVPWQRNPGAKEPDRVPSPVPPVKPKAELDRHSPPHALPPPPSKLERLGTVFGVTPRSGTFGPDHAPNPLARRALRRAGTMAQRAAPPENPDAPGLRDFVAWSYEFGNGSGRQDKLRGYREFKVEAAELSRFRYAFEYKGVSPRAGVFETARRIAEKRTMNRFQFVQELEREIFRPASPRWEEMPLDLGQRQ